MNNIIAKNYNPLCIHKIQSSKLGWIYGCVEY